MENGSDRPQSAEKRIRLGGVWATRRRSRRHASLPLQAPATNLLVTRTGRLQLRQQTVVSSVRFCFRSPNERPQYVQRHSLVAPALIYPIAVLEPPVK